jgi:hypothetical protein
MHRHKMVEIMIFMECLCDLNTPQNKEIHSNSYLFFYNSKICDELYFLGVSHVMRRDL